MRCGLFVVMSEEPASVQMEEEDRQDEDDDERGSEEKHNRQEAGLVRRKLLDFHAALDAERERKQRSLWNRGALSRIIGVT